MHRWSQLFIPTLREAPADAEVASHKLLLRAGYVRQLGAGIYSYLPLGQRALNKIVAIVREEMDRIGQEFLLPALNPREIWEESGRWTGMGDNMFRLKDRKGAELALAMTHEEIMTSIARNELRSYKQLPQIWYQIQTKFRDEPRPKSGLLRVRQFLMKDSYSFDMNEAGLDESYRRHDEAYRRIFTRCGLEFVVVEADSGSMGGSQSQEFMVYTEAGEDLIASSASGYAANLEKATSRLGPVTELEPTGDGMPELVHTPGKASIADVTAFFGIQASQDIKCVAFMGVVRLPNDPNQNEFAALPVAVFLRGDHTVNETKLVAELNTYLQGLAKEQLAHRRQATMGKVVPIVHKIDELRPMAPDELQTYFKAPAGFLGPVGLTEPILVRILDQGLEGRRNLVCGANQQDYHFRNVTPGRDFTPTVVADIRNVNEGELDPVGGEPLRLGKAVEIGHIFKLGYKYSASMGARVLDRDGKEVTPIMGSYGIGMERILTAAIESSAAALARSGPEAGSSGTAEQFVLPTAIAPFEVVVTITNTRDTAMSDAGLSLAEALSNAGTDVLLDDRDERAGVKFKDADLIGIPFRVNIGKKLNEGAIELVDRLGGTTHDLPLLGAAAHIVALIEASKV